MTDESRPLALTTEQIEAIAAGVARTVCNNFGGMGHYREQIAGWVEDELMGTPYLGPEPRERDEARLEVISIAALARDGDDDEYSRRVVAADYGWSYLLDTDVKTRTAPVLPLNRLLVEFTLPDDTRDAAEEVFDFLDSAEKLGATPDGLGWRDADIGELRVWSETPDVPEGVTALRPGSTFKIRDDLGRELDVAAMAWGLASDIGLPWEIVGPARVLDPGAIVSNDPLDASKTYLVIVVEHPDEAIRG